MAKISARQRMVGWFFYDWASQPYHTLLITFIFGPYVAELLGSGTQAQMVWGYGLAAIGAVTAIISPLLGVAADYSGRRLPWIQFFSLFYVLGAVGLWWSQPGNFNLVFLLISFGIGLIGMELTTVFTNALMPNLVEQDKMGRLSGSGWAFGYLGGVLALALMLCFFAQGSSGKTYLGLDPIFGLDANTKEGTRFVGPFTAIWYVLFMIPFFLWVKEKPSKNNVSIASGLRHALPELLRSLKSLPKNASLLAFLLASMCYRDVLNGAYVFGGIYARGVLNWSVVDTGVFGIVAALSGAIFAWLAGRADQRFGSKPVVISATLLLALAIVAVVSITRNSILGIAVPVDSSLPDLLFFGCGALIGAVGGSLQASSRALMIRLAPSGRISEVCALYALSGKATAFLAPLLVALTTKITSSQQMGILPLLLLLLPALWLLQKVKSRG